MSCLTVASTDVVVVGGGIIGSSVAYYLSKQGMKVTLFERRELASEASGSNQGASSSQLMSGENLKLVRESSRIYSTLDRELEYDFELDWTGSYLLMDKLEQWPALEEHAKWLQERGIKTELLTGNELRQINPGLAPDIPGASFCAEDFMVNPMKLVIGFAEASKRLGAEINAFTPVDKIAVDNGKVQSVTTNKGELMTKFLVVAAGAWSPLIGRMLKLRLPIKPRRGQVLVTEAYPLERMRSMIDIDYLVTGYSQQTVKITDEQRIKHGVACTLTQTKNGNWLIGSSRDFPGYVKRTNVETLTAIARRANRFFPKLSQANVIRTMAGLRPFCEDGRFIIDKVDEIEGVVLAIGHHGTGVSLAPVTGQLVAEMIAKNRKPSSIEEFSYTRFKNHSLEGKELTEAGNAS